MTVLRYRGYQLLNYIISERAQTDHAIGKCVVSKAWRREEGLLFKHQHAKTVLHHAKIRKMRLSN